MPYILDQPEDDLLDQPGDDLPYWGWNLSFMRILAKGHILDQPGDDLLDQPGDDLLDQPRDGARIFCFAGVRKFIY